MRLSRRIPAHTKTIKARWCKRDFLVMGEKYRHARRRMRKPLDMCYWCKHKFKDGEMMALAAFEGIDNKLLCQNCAAELMSSEAAEAAKGEDHG